MGVWRTVLRVLVGCLFIGHGTQKLFGWFGGGGLDETEKSFAKLGLNPPRENAIAAGLTEAGGGALLAAGLAMPVAASALTATMLTAVKRVHLQNGPWITKGGYEYNAVLIAALAALVEADPGELSLDAARGRIRSGLTWATLSLAGGALGAYAVDTLSDRGSLAHPLHHAAEGESVVRAAA